MRTNVKKATTPLEDFLRLAEGPPYFELIQGNIIQMPSPIDFHQLTLLALAFQLNGYVSRKIRGSILIAPFDVFLNDTNVFQPDLLFVFEERYNQLIGDDRKLHGAPDWVAEILSPATEKYDRNEKKDVYYRSGVQEYWIVDPIKQTVEIFTRGENDFYLNQNLEREGKVNSILFPDWELDVKDIFRG